MVPLFDSLAHPTIDGKWLDKDVEATFSSLDKSLRKSGFRGACAVGIANKNGYSHESFAKECKKYKSLVPIAGFDPATSSSPSEELNVIKGLDFRGIKIHPRFSNINLKNNNLKEVFQAASSHNLIIFYCTYMHGKLSDYPETDPFYALVSVLKSAPRAKVILLHGGDVALLQYAELARFSSNILLDLSLTMTKYENSSLDMDIAFLFKNFDRKICVGSDFPEGTHDNLARRFDRFSDKLPKEKAENIAFKNLSRFLEANF